MPYIVQRMRRIINGRGIISPENTGELNYMFTQCIIAYIKRKGLSYQTINDVKGALVSAKDEFGRRIADPYEDKKIAENGDVYQDILVMMETV